VKQSSSSFCSLKLAGLFLYRDTIYIGSEHMSKKELKEIIEILERYITSIKAWKEENHIAVKDFDIDIEEKELRLEKYKITLQRKEILEGLAG